MILAGASGEIYLEAYNDWAEKLSSEGIFEEFVIINNAIKGF
jgi:hypothetical protein